MPGHLPFRIGAALLALVAISPAFGLSGRVTDSEGRPVPTANVCYVLAAQEQVCGVTNSEGVFDLPATDIDTIRVFKPGYLPEFRSSIETEQPIVLRLAAIVLVLLRDAEGGGKIERGEVTIVAPTGKQIGPLPVNAAGVRMRTLEPGNVRILAVAEGYAQDQPEPVTLVAGSETKVVIELRRTAEE